MISHPCGPHGLVRIVVNFDLHPEVDELADPVGLFVCSDDELGIAFLVGESRDPKYAGRVGRSWVTTKLSRHNSEQGLSLLLASILDPPHYLEPVGRSAQDIVGCGDQA